MYKVKNAIILAAGRGKRLKDLTNNTPKPLLEIGKESIIEKIIKKLLEIKINNIFIVVGYLGNKFDFLIKKYSVKIINNPNWNKGNNITSIKAVQQHISNSLIINGDLIMKKNLFKNQYNSTISYAEKNENIDEWILNLNSEKNIINIKKNGLNNQGFYQKEILFVNELTAQKIPLEIDNFDINEYYEFLILLISKKYQIDFKIFEVPRKNIFDLDKKEEFLEYANSFK